MGGSNEELQCDQGVPLKLKETFNSTTNKSTFLYGLGYWASVRIICRKIGIIEVCMIWWMNGQTLNDIMEMKTQEKILESRIFINDKMRKLFKLIWACVKIAKNS